jgi:transposase
MANDRKTYTPEFKLQAVKMITDQRLSVAEVARRLGVSESRLHEWKTAARRDGADAFPGSGHQTPLEEENRRLRAENERLEMERDILKKATAFFARQGKGSSPGSKDAGPSTRSR